MTFKEFVEKHEITIENKETNYNPFMNKVRMNHYESTLKRKGKKMTIIFSQGLGIEHEPAADEVLYCVASDINSIESPYEEWCRELGYEEDKQSMKIYIACFEEREKMKRFLTNKQYEELIRCEE